MSSLQANASALITKGKKKIAIHFKDWEYEAAQTVQWSNVFVRAWEQEV